MEHTVEEQDYILAGESEKDSKGYTKGEWEVDVKVNHWGDKCYAVEAINNTVAILSDNDKHTEANAHLIVAAPNMEKALKMVDKYCTLPIPVKEAVNQALAKAEGK